MLQKKRMEKCKVNPNLFLSSKLQINYRLSVKKKKKKKKMTLLQTFWLGLPAQVQHLSLLSSMTPSLWLCQCKNSMSACWDVWPVFWQWTGVVTHKEINLKEKRKASSQLGSLPLLPYRWIKVHCLHVKLSLHKKNVKLLRHISYFLANNA